MATGSTASLKLGDTTSSPSTADSTEIAGVITLSPKNSDAPNTASISDSPTTRGALVNRRASAPSAMTPPSPSLSARMTNSTYLTDTMIVIDQKTSEMTP